MWEIFLGFLRRIRISKRNELLKISRYTRNDTYFNYLFMLKISSSWEYALLLVKYLTHNPGIHTIGIISEKLSIKEPFLRKTANKLEKTDIIISHKWRYGGVELVKKDISVYDILSAVWEDLSIAICSHGKCDSSESCGITPTIANIQRGFDTILKITRL